MKRILVAAVIALAALCAAAPAAGPFSPAFAGEDVFSEGSAYPEHYPERFSGKGPINRIDRDEIVIGDRLFGLSHGVTYATPTKQHASWREFRPGRYVGYIKDANRRITSLWLIR